MDALIALRDDGLHAQEGGALGRPVPARPGAVLLAGQHHERGSFGLVAHGGIVDRHHLAGGEVEGPVPLLARNQRVADAHVPEGATHHDLVIAAAGPEGVPVHLLHAVLPQVPGGGTVLGDGPGGRDVIGGDRVAQHRERARAGDVAHRRRLRRQVDEEGGLLDVGGVRIPGVAAALRHLQRLPGLVALEHRRVATLEQLRLERAGHRRLDLFRRRPDVPQVDRLAVAARAQRLLAEIDIHPARQGEGDDQHGGGEVVGPHLRMNPRLEVPVAAQHRRGDERMLVDQPRDHVGQRPAVPDAGGAAVPDHVEPEPVEVGEEPRAFQVIGHHPRARARGCSSPRAGSPARAPPPSSPPVPRRSSPTDWRCWCSW